MSFKDEEINEDPSFGQFKRTRSVNVNKVGRVDHVDSLQRSWCSRRTRIIETGCSIGTAFFVSISWALLEVDMGSCFSHSPSVLQLLSDGLHHHDCRQNTEKCLGFVSSG